MIMNLLLDFPLMVFCQLGLHQERFVFICSQIGHVASLEGTRLKSCYRRLYDRIDCTAILLIPPRFQPNLQMNKTINQTSVHFPR